MLRPARGREPLYVVAHWEYTALDGKQKARPTGRLLSDEAFGAYLGRGADLEHLRAALRALAFGRRATVLHLDLDGVFHLALRLALDAVRLRGCHDSFSLDGRWAPPVGGGRIGTPYSHARTALLRLIAPDSA